MGNLNFVFVALSTTLHKLKKIMLKTPATNVQFSMKMIEYHLFSILQSVSEEMIGFFRNFFLICCNFWEYQLSLWEMSIKWDLYLGCKCKVNNRDGLSITTTFIT